MHTLFDGGYFAMNNALSLQAANCCPGNVQSYAFH